MATTKRTRKIERRRRRVARRLEAAAVRRDFCLVDAEAEPLTLEAAAAGDGEADGPKVRKFAMTAYTGGKLLAAGYLPHGVVVDLSGLTITAKSRPILRDHDIQRIVGHTTDVQISGGSIRLSGVISGGNEHAAEVASSADAGFPWQASIGARPTHLVYVDRGEKVQVNGRTFVGPVYVARKATLREVSFVALGADDNTSARMLAATQGDPEMDFETWLKAKGYDDPKTINAAVKSALRAAYDAEIEAEEADELDDQEPSHRTRKPARRTVRATAGDDEDDEDETDPRAVLRASAADEIERQRKIKAIVARYGVTQIEIDADGKKTPVDLEAHAVREGWSDKDVELHALRASRGSGPAIHSHTGDLSAQPLEAALLLAVGVDEKEIAKSLGDKAEQTLNAALGPKYAGAGLHMLMDATIHAAGKHFSGNRKSNDYIRAALEADKTIRGSGFTTLSLSGLLGNVANKTMLASYNAQKTVWQLICGVRNHSDFKAQTRYRLDSTGSFRKVGPDGELKHVGLEEAGYSAQLDTFGALLTLTRQDQINDDLGAFAQIPEIMGRMSGVRIEEAVFTLLLSNPASFFSAGNGNLLTGAESELGIPGYTAAESAFGDQVDSNGKPILVEPSVLLTGTTLKVTAEQLAKDTKIEVTGSTDAVHFANNPHAGKFAPASSGYLNNTAIRDQDGAALTGQSATQWYLFADPVTRAAVTIAFLNGRRVPTIEFAEADFEKLGMSWRAYHDFGVAMEDPKAAQKNAGA